MLRQNAVSDHHSGSPSKNGMTVISNQNCNVQVELEILWGSRNFLASTQQLDGGTPTIMRIGMHKSHMEH